MTRIAGIADLHIGPQHLCTLEDQEAALGHVVDELVHRKVGLLLVAGDVFHTNRPTPAMIAIAARFFRSLEVEGITAVVAKGNHDPDGGDILRWLRGSAVVPETPTVLRFDDRIQTDVAVFPWLPDSHVRAQLAGEASREEIAERLSRAAAEILAGLRAQRRPGVPLLLVGHFTVAGSETPTGFNMGWRPGTSWVVPVEELAGFDLAAVGHVHAMQTPTPQVAVPGSLLPLDFSESQSHGFVVADLNDACPVWEFVEIPTPKVRTVIAEDRGGLIDMLRWIADPDEEIRHDLGGAFVRFQVHADEATAREYPPARIERALLDAGARRAQVELTVDREDRARDEGMTSELLPLTAIGRYFAGRTDLEDAPRDRAIAAAADVAGEVMADRDVAGVGELDVVRLEASDFLGLEHVDLDLDGISLAVLQGPVGTGKSALGADLLRFALFGSTRYGAKASERVIREGADMAVAAVTLRDGSEHEYRVERKVKRDGRGRVTSMLDVLRQDTYYQDDDGARHPRFVPISTGKIADGDAAISKLLGRLTDRTLCAANVVLQRDADRFASAPPEQRKDLLSEAAGLELYGDLSLRTAKRLNDAEKELAQLQAKAEPLRARAGAVERLEAEKAEAERERDAAAAEVTRLELLHTAATEDLERARDRETAYAKIRDDAAAVQNDVERVERSIADRAAKTEAARAAWQHKVDVARDVLAHKAELEDARTKLAGAKSRLVSTRDGVEAIERELAGAQRADRERAAAERRIAELERDLARERGARAQNLADLQATLRTERRQLDELKASGCLEGCEHREGCTVREAAAAQQRRVVDLEQNARSADQATPRELDYERQIVQLRGALPPAVDVDAVIARLSGARREMTQVELEIRDLEKQTAVAEKIAAAQQVVDEHDEAMTKLEAEHKTETEKLQAELAPLRAKRGEMNAQLLSFAGSPVAERERAEREQGRLAADLRMKRTEHGAAADRAALLTGRLEELRAAADELAALDVRIAQGSAAVAAWKELIVAWRACRVMTLENSVIPAVEDLANQTLRRFPYGLQLRFATQREKKGGDGLAEVLDIEIIGGKAPVYEGLSGGQRTAVDASLHIAIALVVARRQTTRLRYLYLDEPEGLDADGRAAFASIARWAADELGLRTIVASHHEDLVEQLAGQVIRIEGGPGAARVGGVDEEREAIAV